MSKAQKLSKNLVVFSMVIGFVLSSCLFAIACIGAQITLEEVFICLVIGLTPICFSSMIYGFATAVKKCLH